MINLDDVDVIRTSDPQRMGDRIAELPEQVRNAWAIIEKMSFPGSHRQAESIVFVGMGGSAIGGDVARAVTIAQASVPIQVWRDYGLPGFVGPETLVVALSHSGNTEETLSAFDEAVRRGARTIAVTTGGDLARRAHSNGVPIVLYQYDSQPRAAVGYLATLALGVLSRLGYVPDLGDTVEDTADLLDQMDGLLRPEHSTIDNHAKRLALALEGRLGVIYAAGPLAIAAQRWKTQLNENSKNWSCFDALPELNHNSVVGFEHPADIRARLLVVFLTSPSDPVRITVRRDVTQRLLDRLGIACEKVTAEGSTPMAQVFSALFIGDYTSYYLALANGVDPTPVEAISYLKGVLAQAPV